MSEIKLDQETISGAAQRLKSLSDNAGSTASTIKGVHTVLWLDDALTNAFSNSLVAEIKTAAKTISGKQEQMEQYASLVDAATKGLVDADTGTIIGASVKLTLADAVRTWATGTTVLLWGWISGSDKNSSSSGILHSGGGHTTPGRVTASDLAERMRTAAEDAKLSEYDIYRRTVEQITKKYPTGEEQNSGEWMCSWAATATMLNRKRVLEGKEPCFTRDGVYAENSTMEWSHPYSADGSTYRTVYQVGPISEKDLITKLDEHPEGVVIYTSTSEGMHALVITDYVRDDEGMVCFYADDNVNNKQYKHGGGESGRIKLDQTYTYTIQHDPLGNAQYISWIE